MTNANMVKSPADVRKAAGQVSNTDPMPPVPAPESESRITIDEEPVDSPGPRPNFDPMHKPGLYTEKPDT